MILPMCGIFKKKKLIEDTIEASIGRGWRGLWKWSQSMNFQLQNK